MAEDTTYLLENGRVFDGFSSALTEPGVVVIADGEIKDITAIPPALQNANRIDCRGQTITPGLIDAHIHTYLPTSDYEAVDRMPRTLLSQHGAAMLRGALNRGFTTVRDAGGADIGLRMALEQGLIDGPRLLISGKMISQTGGHGDGRAAHHEDPCGCSYVGALTVLADGPHEVRKAVREELRKGANQIKIFASGGITSPTDPVWMRQFTHEEIETAVHEASTRRTYVMAHCHTSDSAQACVEAGVRSIEHGTELNDATAKLIADTGCFVVPTLVIGVTAREHGRALGYKPESLEKIAWLSDHALRSIETCATHGVKLGFGTDLPGNFGNHQNREFSLRRDVQSSCDVLRSATSVNAELLQMEGMIGCIKEGAYADVLVVDGDPTQDVSILSDPGRHINLIMKGGRIVKSRL